MPYWIGASDSDTTQDIPSLCDSLSKNFPVPFCILIRKLNGVSSSNAPPIPCIISDGGMTFSLDAADEFGIPAVLFWTTNACGFLGYTRFHSLVQKGFTPLKDASYLTNGHLETTIDWIPGMEKIRLRDLPSFIRTTDANEIVFNFVQKEIERASKASALILNTFDPFETDVLGALSDIFPTIYTIGPLQLLLDQTANGELKNIGSNLWREQSECIELHSKEPNSVVYVNFGSIAVMTTQELIEFAWGLANSRKPFLWIIRPDLVTRDSAILPPEFLNQTKDRGMSASWGSQERILKHPSIGGFLSHMGWNSTVESGCGAVPMLCWPFFAEQPTNCRYTCNEWGIGMEMENDVKREEAEKLVRELMDGEKGREMKTKLTEWRAKAEEATRPGGSLHQNLEKLLGFLQAIKMKN